MLRIIRRRVAIVAILVLVTTAAVVAGIYLSTSGPNSNTTSTSQTTGTEANTSADSNFFIQPYTSQVAAVREWFMQPFRAVAGSFGYDSHLGMIRGGYWNASTAGGGNGWHDGFVLIDSQILGGATLDYLNAQRGITTNINGTFREWLSNTTFYDPTTGQTIRYDGQDRREALFGKIIACIQGTTSQSFYAPDHTMNGLAPITSAFPNGRCIDPSGMSMSQLGPQIDLSYSEGKYAQAYAYFTVTVNGWTPTTGTGAGGSTGGYFNDLLDSGSSSGNCKNTRALAYWIEAARATGYWNLNSQTRTMAQQAVNQIWANQAPDGGMYVNYQTCTKTSVKQTAESSGVTLIAFDPRVPSWFKSNASKPIIAAPLSSSAPETGASGAASGSDALGGSSQVQWIIESIETRPAYRPA